MSKIYDKIVAFLGSKYFFGLIVILFFIQALWIAITFKILPYDENFHYPVIQIFAQQISPFIANQPTQYDYLGNLSNGSATLYHYLMSFPYRLLDIFGANYEAKVIVLRIINIILACVGLIVYSTLFRRVGFRQIFINIAFLFYILIPIVPLTAATINYDNLLLPLAGLFFLFSVNILIEKKIRWENYAGVVITGCLASLTKFMFLPLFAVGIIYISLFTYRNKNIKDLPKNISRSFKKSNKIYLGLWATALVIPIVIFSGVYLKNIIQYKTPTPSCQAVLSMDRCLKNAVFRRDLNAVNTKDQRPKLDPPSLMSAWAVGLNSQNSANAFSGEVKTAPNRFLTAIYLLVFVSLGSILYAWQSLQKNKAWYFLLSMILALVSSLFLLNITGYYKTHMLLANQPRYLLSIVPIFLVFTAVSINHILGSRFWLKVTLVIAILAVFTQGGGVSTYISHGSEAYYWDNKNVIRVNQSLQKIVSPLVKGE